MQIQVKTVTENWLIESESDLELDQVYVFDNDIDIVLHGFEPPTMLEYLGEELQMLLPKLESATLDILFSKEFPVPKDGAAE